MIFSVTVPFFALILFGYVAASRRWVPPESVPAFNGFLLYFAVPAMLFRFAAHTPFADIVNGRFFLAWSLAGLVVLLGVTLVAWRGLGESRRNSAFLALASAVSNSGYLGVPLIVALLGERAAAPVILSIVADLVVVGSVGLLVAEMDGATGRGWRQDLRDGAVRIALNPFVLSMLAGAVFSRFGWVLVAPVDGIVKLLADAAGPCALFAIGVSLVRPDAKLRSPKLTLPVVAKLLVHPLAVWGAMRGLAIESFTARAAVLTAALPSAGWVFIFATRYEADSGRISATILLTTAIAFATFSCLAWFLGVGHG
ncbi:MAG TPA: AEC family transporter [Usitatibacter sp.]|nr:AEC family transporter [Usitatibacter sp.]